MLHVFFHNDADGKCGAAIVRRYWFGSDNLESAEKGLYDGDMKFIECDYKDDLTDRIDMMSSFDGDSVVAVDFSFKPEVMDKIKNIVGTDHIYWIDHHRTAFEYNYGFIPKGIRNANLSGCELAWKFLNPHKAIPMGVILIGDYDIWTHRYGELTEHFYLGLQLYDLNPEGNVWDSCVLSESSQGEENIKSLAEMGKTCKTFRDNFCKQYVKDFGFETTFEGYKCFAVGLYEFGSKVFGDLMDKYDLCLSFEFDGKTWEVGLYTNNPEINVGKIAQKYGGGGHPGAAGFPCKELPFGK
jgi:oligoribonuclease NrnB/cAMP/cGMP phosphodiesterase (DHH superfamily)